MKKFLTILKAVLRVLRALVRLLGGSQKGGRP